jgi:hypothetical protein
MHMQSFLYFALLMTRLGVDSNDGRSGLNHWRAKAAQAPFRRNVERARSAGRKVRHRKVVANVTSWLLDRAAGAWSNRRCCADVPEARRGGRGILGNAPPQDKTRADISRNGGLEYDLAVRCGRAGCR